MEIVNNYRTNCYNLTENSFVKEWVNNETKDTIIDITPLSFAPNLFYHNYSDGIYQWCGPLLLVAEYFAKFSKNRIRLEKRGSPSAVTDAFKNAVFNKPHIGLVSMYAPHYFQHVEMYRDFIKYTTAIRFTPSDRILARTRIGEDSLLKFFQCFEIEVYLGIIFSIIIISFITSVYKRSLKAFLTTFWSYFSVILSDYYSLKVNTKFERLLCGTWLITCTVLLAAFSGQLRELVIKPKPVYSIDSWDDLNDWNLPILAGDNTELVAYTVNFPEKKFSKQIYKKIEPREDDDYSMSKHVKERLKSGELAIISPYDILQIIKKNLTDDGLREDFDFHISRNGSEHPYFSLVNTEDPTLLGHLDHGIKILREQGIFENAIKIALNPRRLGPDIEDKIDSEEAKVEDVTFFQMRGIFILYIIFITVTIVIVTFEYNMK